MAEILLNTTFKIRRGTAARWTTVNPVLKAGEPGVELDTGKLKIGDGTTAWNSLSYTANPATAYPVTMASNTTEEFASSYSFYQGSTLIGTVNIAKDMVVQSGQVIEKTESGTWGEAGTYIEMTLANSANTKIYVNVNDLVDIMTSGSVSTDPIVIAIDQSTNQITATLTDGKILRSKLAADVQLDIENSIQEIKIGDTAFTIDEDDTHKASMTAAAMKTALGINITDVAQTAGDVLVLYGGSATALV